MIFSSSVLLDTDLWPVRGRHAQSLASSSGTRAAHRPLPEISPHTSAEKHPTHRAPGFHARHYRPWASASSHPHPRRSVPCPAESPSRAERFWENLANHPMMSPQTWLISRRDCSHPHYIKTDIIGAMIRVDNMPLQVRQFGQMGTHGKNVPAHPLSEIES